MSASRSAADAGGPRRPGRFGAGAVGGAVLLLLLGAAPAWAHPGDPTVVEPVDTVAVALRVALLVLGGALAGVAVLRGPAGGPGGMTPRAAVIAAGGVLLAGLVALVAVAGHTGAELVVGVVHSVAAVLWLGAAVLVATAGSGRRVAVLRRLAPVAVGSSVVLLGTGVVQSLAAGLRLDAATAGSSFGRLVGVKLLLLVAVAVLGALALARAALDRGGGVRRARFAAAGLATATALGAVLVVVQPPAPPAETGVPLLRTVVLGERAVPVAVVPQRPGPNLVHVGVPGLRVGTDPEALAPATVRPGAPGGWAVVELPAGTDTLWVVDGSRRAPLRLDLGAPAPPVEGLDGPDGPECATALVGAFDGAAAPPTSCPGEALSAADAAVVAATVRFLAGRGVPAVHLVGDASARSVAAVALARDTAARAGLRVAGRPDRDGAVLLLGGWSGAAGWLAGDAIRPVTIAGTWTAPWLATASLLGRATGTVTALDFDPRGIDAQRYLADLRRTGLTALASPAGMAARRGPGGRGPVRVYSAALVSFLPDGIGMSGAATDRWIPGGAMTPVSPPLT